MARADMAQPPTIDRKPPMIDRKPVGSDRGVDASLIRQWRVHGDLGAREAFVRKYIPLARKLARRYAHTSEPYDDLFQVASLGLLKAVERFDPDRDVAFSAFAVPTMLGELKRHFRDTTRSIHLPRGLQELSLSVQEATSRLEARTGRVPTAHDLAQYLELDLNVVIEALEVIATHRPISLDAPLDTGPEEEGSVRHDVIGQIDEGYGLVETSSSLAAAMRRLPVKDRRVFALRYTHGLTQREIANVIGVSQMQVSRILRRLTDELRATMRVREAPEPTLRRRRRSDRPATELT